MDADGRKALVVLGSTGSIGTQTLEVVRAYPNRFRILGLAARANADLIARQVEEFSPETVCILEAGAADRLRRAVGDRCRVLEGPEGMVEIARWPGADMLLIAISGNAALAPTVAAIEGGRDVALATKEVLVAGGHVVTETARRTGARLLPVDSEHSAIFQCLQGEDRSHLRKVILTASGGPFLDVPLDELANVIVEQALAHPTWRMGSKITIDSATMMNKGLEVIEAHWLFGASVDQIEVVIHPQSIVHSMVEFSDGSIMAQMGIPDMRLPIQYALWYPERAPQAFRITSPAEVGELTFREPDPDRFPCLGLGYAALRAGGTTPCAMNAANEVAVAAFLAGRIRFTEIAAIIENVMCGEPCADAGTLEEVLEGDRRARAEAAHAVERMGRKS
jgi:1-deoxy-D-xylulose-5-phosphate reductoisomerase